MMSGEGNPFWGKVHSPEIREKIRTMRRARQQSMKRTGPPKGYKHTPEAKEKITAALKDRWKTNRDKMLAAIEAGNKTRKLNRTEQPRHRSNFTPLQRREWKADKCVWCSSTDNLTLDHIIPVMAGGKNVRVNAQTLCHPCNLWKLVYVDRALTIALLGSKSG